MRRKDAPDKDILYSLYVVDNKSMSDIAVLFNVSAMTVRAWLSNYKIKIRTPNWSIYKEIRSTEFSDIQKDLIVGSVLGDGCLRVPKRGKNAYFCERHCENQSMYLQWKNDLLLPFTKSSLQREEGGTHNISGVDCVTQSSYKCSTVSHPFLTRMWKLFYDGNGKKLIPDIFGDIINLFIFAVWICDDGSLVWNNIRRTYRIDLHTESFVYEDVVKLVRCVHKLFDGNVIIIPRNYANGTKYYISLRGKKELHHLCMLMKDLVPDCMKYKFDTYI